MPIYEYLCEANGRVVEVSHKMNERLSTWGEVCQRAEIAPGRTAAEAPVTKLMSAGFVSTGNQAAYAGCDMGSCSPDAGTAGPCGAGMCGLQ